jgi:hypothetical protein
MTRNCVLSGRRSQYVCAGGREHKSIHLAKATPCRRVTRTALHCCRIRRPPRLRKDAQDCDVDESMGHGARLLYRYGTLIGKRVRADCSTLFRQPPEFLIAFDHKGQLVRAAEDVSPPCLPEQSRRVDDVKPGVAGAKTTTQSARHRGLQQATRENVALVDNNVV